MEEIETLLLSSNPRSDRSLAYGSLLQFQEISVNDSSAIETLSERSQYLLPIICSDASVDDEEIAAQALKCLGFMIYHPSLVASIREDVAHLVVELLLKIIMTTKMKVICNLGVWCISIQQFNSSFIASHLHSLLRAVMHALENPVGSLSTTFEAIQAVMKLATQLSENMRGLSDIWAPPIYRRLLSIDKRERDISERCLLKIKSSILPPTLTLSKVLAADMRQKLLPGMSNMLQDHGKKLYAIQAWGWYIRLLGCNAVKNRHLVNEMLKIPERTFSDPDPQVQIASVVAWEGLIDALIQPSPLAQHNCIAQGNDTHQTGPVPSHVSTRNGENQVDGLPKSIKLIMTPLVGLMSSRCDASVRSSCLNTWCYLLHKLDVSVNCPSVVKTVLEPIFEMTFHSGPDEKNVCLWNTCVDILYEFISSKIRDGENDMNGQLNLCNLPSKTTSLGSPTGDQGSWKGTYPIKWLPWDLSKLDFHLKMVRSLACQGSMTSVNPKTRKLAFNSALRIFRTVLEGVQVEFKKTTNDYNEILLCINTILKFAKWACEDDSKLIDVGSSDLLCTAIQFLEVIKEELDPSVLASPLYRVHLDLKCIKDMQYAKDIEYPKVPYTCSFALMDMVTPMVYLTLLYLSAVVQYVFNLSDTERILEAMRKYPNFIFSSYDPLENIHATIHLLYMHRQKLSHGGFCWLKLWRVFAMGLKEQIDAVGDLNFLKSESDSTGYLVVYCALCYPFVACYSSHKLFNSANTSDCEELCLVSSQGELELVIEVWRLLYDSASCVSLHQCSDMNSFTESLCKVLVTVLSDSISIPKSSTESCLKENESTIFLFIYGEVAIHVLKHIQVWDDGVLLSRVRETQEDSHYKQCSHIKCSLEFVTRFMMLSVVVVKANLLSELAVVSRVFEAMACFVDRLYSKRDMFLLMEAISDPLVQWLSLCREIKEGNAIHQLQLFWTQMLDCFHRIQPPIIFNSVFLDMQAPLLQTALDHPYAPISDATIAFWKSTYAKQTKLCFPQCLLPVLDKLSRSGRISFHKGSTSFSANSSAVVEIIARQLRYRVTATKKRSSKRVGFAENSENGIESFDISPLGLEKKRLKLAEHHMKVGTDRQEVEGRFTGHDSGVRTCTNVDFTQGNADSHARDELRNSDSILKILRKAV